MSPSTTDSVLLSRLTNLEESVRRLRMLAVITIALAGIFAFNGAASIGPTYVRASDGSKMFLSGSTLNFIDPQGKARLKIGLLTGTHGAAGMNVYDGSGRRRLFAGEDATGKPNLTEYDAQNTKRLAVAEGDAGMPGFFAYDTSTTLRAYAGGFTDGDYGLQARNSSGTVTWHANSSGT